MPLPRRPRPAEPGDSRNPWFNGIFGPLFKSTINVVVVSNPYAIDEKTARPGDDRIDRIESVVKFYKSKLKVPVYLLGHSNRSTTRTAMPCFRS
jgi:hypothetical protein